MHASVGSAMPAVCSSIVSHTRATPAESDLGKSLIAAVCVLGYTMMKSVYTSCLHMYTHTHTHTQYLRMYISHAQGLIKRDVFGLRYNIMC